MQKGGNKVFEFDEIEDMEMVRVRILARFVHPHIRNRTDERSIRAEEALNGAQEGFGVFDVLDRLKGANQVKGSFRKTLEQPLDLLSLKPQVSL